MTPADDCGRKAANVRKLQFTTLVLVAVGIGACAAPGRQSLEPLVAKPATWTSAVMDARQIDRGDVLLQYNTCHAEPTPIPNTSVRVWEITDTPHGHHSTILERIYWYAWEDLHGEIKKAIRPSDVVGLDALTLEINWSMKSPDDGSIIHYNFRYWTIPFSKRVFLVIARQPVVPDPDCSPELEKTISEILFRLAAEQAAAVAAPQATRP